MKTVAFIPIKLNNERLPGKNTKCFDDGTPLVNIIQESLLKLKAEKLIDEIYVYCSDENIVEYLIDGVKFLKRPNTLDSFSTLGAEIYASFVSEVTADIYVLAHATSPFVTVDHIKQCILAVKNDDYDSAFCAKKLQTFLWQDNAPINFDMANPPRTQDMKPVYYELSTPYVFTKSSFAENKARTGKKPFICSCGDIECVDIDTKGDFEFANVVYMNVIKNKGDVNEKN